MRKYISAYFKSEKLPKWFKILNLSILLPVLLWPLVFYGTIFFFDNPSNYTYTYLMFFLFNAYPLYLIILALLNARLYIWNRPLGVILPIVILLSIVSGATYIIIMMSQF